jgi:hypothetical protein
VSSVATAITAAATTAPITSVLAAMPPTAAPPAAPAPAAPPAPAVAGAGAGAACANTDCEAIIKTEATKAEVILDFMDTLSNLFINPHFEFNTTLFAGSQNSIAFRFFTT